MTEIPKASRERVIAQWVGGFDARGTFQRFRNKDANPQSKRLADKIKNDETTLAVWRLAQTRRERNYAPIEIAQRIQGFYSDLIGVSGVFRFDTLDAWLQRVAFEDWQDAPCETDAERAVHGAGYGHEAYWVNGGKVVSRSSLIPDPPLHQHGERP